MPDQNRKTKLTARQSAILEMIRQTVAERGYPPSIREIGDAVGLASPSSVAHQLRTLEERGLLRRDPHRPRAMELRSDASQKKTRGQGLGGDSDSTGAGAVAAGGAGADAADWASTDVAADVVPIPLVGRIAAGGPILADEQIESVYGLPRDLVGRGELFILRVVGDSMIEAAICDGDLVVVRRQPTAENGEIVAALIGEEATVKTLDRRNGRVLLRPANPNYEPIAGDDTVILGRVVTVLRKT
ncbi:MAG: transcriptional repressor LexA [Candidatus Nanopelagicales bacterium]|nr:transcriptional repressor LexA [Candidatus Nanopelagicales bacterium]